MMMDKNMNNAQPQPQEPEKSQVKLWIEIARIIRVVLQWLFKDGAN